MLYQKAQEALLSEALEPAGKRVGAELGLLRHCRDGEGKVYGVQENYEAEVGSAFDLWAWRLGLVVLLPIAAADLLIMTSVLIILLAVLLPSVVLLGVLGAFFPESRFAEWLENDLGEWLGQPAIYLELAITWPMILGLTGLVRLTAFRRIRAQTQAFFASRVVFAGTGAVQPEGRFAVSPRGLAIKLPMRMSALPDSRGIFDPTNLAKQLMQPMTGDFNAPLRLFGRRQRLQMGVSEAQRCQLGEYLTLGTAMLVLDMAEAGALGDAPRLLAPVQALHTFSADPGLGEAVDTREGQMTALELQRWYLEAAERWVASHDAPSLEAKELLQTWREVLGLLESKPGQLIGRVDWITKRYLLETAGAGAPQEVLQKIDLRYHELGQGYLARLEAEGLAPRVVSEAAVERAMHQAPVDTPAHVRGRLIRSLSGGPEAATIDWDSIRIGSALKAKVIRLSDYR